MARVRSSVNLQQGDDHFYANTNLSYTVVTLRAADPQQQDLTATVVDSAGADRATYVVPETETRVVSFAVPTNGRLQLRFGRDASINGTATVDLWVHPWGSI